MCVFAGPLDGCVIFLTESSSVTSNNAGSEDEEALAPATVRREPSANVTHAQSPLNPCEPSQPAIGYFNCGLVGYALGFAVTFYASVAWDSPQVLSE